MMMKNHSAYAAKMSAYTSIIQKAKARYDEAVAAGSDNTWREKANFEMALEFILPEMIRETELYNSPTVMLGPDPFETKGRDL